MGLRRKQGANPQEGEQFDIRMTVEDFKRDVYAYSVWKPTMWIHVCHVKRKDLPTFVFPGGVRPSPPTRSSESRKSLASYPFQPDAVMSRKRRKVDEANRGASLTESLSTGACISDATSLDQTIVSKQIEPDFSVPNSGGGVPENISIHDQGIPGLDESKCAAGPLAASVAFPGPLAMEKHVIEQSSAQVSINCQGSSDVCDGLEGLLRSETQNNVEAEGVKQSESSTAEQAVEVALVGNAAASSIQPKADLEELEVLSTYLLMLVRINGFSCFFILFCILQCQAVDCS